MTYEIFLNSIREKAEDFMSGQPAEEYQIPFCKHPDCQFHTIDVRQIHNAFKDLRYISFIENTVRYKGFTHNRYLDDTRVCIEVPSFEHKYSGEETEFSIMRTVPRIVSFGDCQYRSSIRVKFIPLPHPYIKIFCNTSALISAEFPSLSRILSEQN